MNISKLSFFKIIGFFWIVVILYNSLVVFLTQGLFPELDQSIYRAIFSEVLINVPWILLTPLIIKLSLRFDIFSNLRFDYFFVHLLFFIIISAFLSIWQPLVNKWLFTTPFDIDRIQYDFIRFLGKRFIVYTGLVLFIAAAESYRKSKKLGYEKSSLLNEFKKERLLLLQVNSQAKMFTRTLDLIKKNIPKPVLFEKNIDDFSDLLRGLFKGDQEKAFVSVKEDIEFMSKYCSLMGGILSKKIVFDYSLRNIDDSLKIPSISLIIGELQVLFQSLGDNLKNLDRITYRIEKKEFEIYSLVFSGIHFSNNAIIEGFKKDITEKTVPLISEWKSKDCKIFISNDDHLFGIKLIIDQ